ncbi:MAG: ankyrin repeat domain-containing protein [Elusimicrobiota bacterium]
MGDLDVFVDRYKNGLLGRGIEERTAEKQAKLLRNRYCNNPIFADPIVPEEESNYDFIVCKAKRANNYRVIVDDIETRIKNMQTFYYQVQKEQNIVIFGDEEKLEDTEEIDEKESFGRTRLATAALEGDLEQVIQLLSLGADPSIKDNSGHTPLQIAQMEGHQAIVDVIQEVLKEM